MKLYYWQPNSLCEEGAGNFGDELNPWLWGKELRGIFDDDENQVFFGIGTVIRKNMSPDRKMVIFGAGAESDDVDKADKNWSVYFVRGPQTAKAIGVEHSKAITDPAILVSKYFSRQDEVKFRFGFMPHIHQTVFWGEVFKDVCEELGILYVDPRESVDEVIRKIGAVEVMISEAMHAAIVADSLGVKWIPVYTRLRPSKFKWVDWCSSLNLPYEPQRIINLSHPAKKMGVKGSIIDSISRKFFSCGLKKVMNNALPIVSKQEVRKDRVARIQEQISLILYDYQNQ